MGQDVGIDSGLFAAEKMEKGFGGDIAVTREWVIGLEFLPFGREEIIAQGVLDFGYEIVHEQ